MKDYDTDLVLLEVQDDGIGFDMRGIETTTEQRGSLGLRNMTERTELMSGIFRIDSSPGKGTTIRVLIPLNEEAAERLRRGS
jgi:signal transduction histidine kinase